MRSALLILSLTACTSSMLDDAPCPCTEGFVCCQTTRACLPINRINSPDCPSDVEPERISLLNVEPPNGPSSGGVSLTLTGTFFSKVESVAVGASTCEDLSIIDDTRLTCTAPPGPFGGGWVTISLLAKDGQITRLENAFFYPAPMFDAPSALSLRTEAHGVGVGVVDANFDGRPDLLFSRTEGPSRLLFLNRGDFNFEDVTPASWQKSLGTHTGFAIADFTGDGMNDVIVGIPESARATYPATKLLVASAMGLQVEDVPEISVVDGGIYTPIATDLDGDMDMDLVGAVNSSGNASPLVVALNDSGNLVETPSWVQPGLPKSQQINGAALGDFDRDGDEDLVVCGSATLLFENTGTQFVDITKEAGLRQTFARSCRVVYAADHDADGDLDLTLLLKADPGGRSGTYIFRNDTPSGQRMNFRASPSLEGEWPQLLCGYREEVLGDTALLAGAKNGVWLDYEFDGDLDLFLPYPLPQCPTAPLLYRSNIVSDTGSTFSFTPLILDDLPIMAGVTGLTFADLDTDGDIDLVFNEWANSNRVLVRNLAIENGAGGALTLGRRLVVRVQSPSGALMTGLTIELDMDGPEGAPDFEPGQGKLQVQVIGAPGRGSSTMQEAWFGLGAHEAPVWVRARLADGTVLLQEAAAEQTELTLQRN